MTDNVVVSVIVVNLNRRDLLARCLESLWHQTFSNFEVIVVENGSTDDSLEYLRSIHEPRLRIVPLPANKVLPAAAIQASPRQQVNTLRR